MFIQSTEVTGSVQFIMGQETVKFNNGNTYPILGLGTWKSKPHEVTQAVKDAIDIGYRHFDCAPVYENEKEVGAAIASKIKEGVIKREDIFVTSKLWNSRHRPERVEPALRKTLSDLGLETLDLYLMHSPMAFKDGDVTFPTDSSGAIITEDVDYLDTWRAMEKVVEKGLAKSIGVSNFNAEQVARVVDNCKIKPVTNQVECHIYLNQTKLSEFCKSRGVTITAYSCFGAPDRDNANPNDPKILEDAKIKQLAAKYNKSPAQIILRYLTQRGILVIPKSVTKSRIRENFNIFDFQINAEDMNAINDLNCDNRLLISRSSSLKDHKYFPFNAEF